VPSKKIWGSACRRSATNTQFSKSSEVKRTGYEVCEKLLRSCLFIVSVTSKFISFV